MAAVRQAYGGHALPGLPVCRTKCFRPFRLKPLVLDRWSTTRPGVPTMMCGRLASAMAWQRERGKGQDCEGASRQLSCTPSLLSSMAARGVPSARARQHAYTAATAAVACVAASAVLPPPRPGPPHLCHHVDAAHQHRALDAYTSTQRLELLGNLDGQLSRRAEAQSKERLRLIQQVLQQGG